jgi:hypothetical protein
MGTNGFDLTGWRCLACGYSVVSQRDITHFIAYRVIRKQILAEAQRAQLHEFVRSVIHCPPHDEFLTRDSVNNWVTKSGLHIREDNGWLRPCPSCNGNDTAVYRWLLVEEGDYRFVPSHENLPLRSSATSKSEKLLKMFTSLGRRLPRD